MRHRRPVDVIVELHFSKPYFRHQVTPALSARSLQGSRSGLWAALAACMDFGGFDKLLLYHRRKPSLSCIPKSVHICCLMRQFLDSRTIINDDVEYSACLVLNDAVEKCHVCLISNIELAMAFPFDHLSVVIGTVRLRLDK